MTPKEKAEELNVGFWYLTNDSRIAKQCALIAVDEMIKEIGSKYWYDVKKEIEKL
jgi:hypothetical protein